MSSGLTSHWNISSARSGSSDSASSPRRLAAGRTTVPVPQPIHCTVTPLRFVVRLCDCPLLRQVNWRDVVGAYVCRVCVDARHVESEDGNALSLGWMPRWPGIVGLSPRWRSDRLRDNCLRVAHDSCSPFLWLQACAPSGSVGRLRPDLVRAGLSRPIMSRSTGYRPRIPVGHLEVAATDGTATGDRHVQGRASRLAVLPVRFVRPVIRVVHQGSYRASVGVVRTRLGFWQWGSG
jgi:hypothetical protein